MLTVLVHTHHRSRPRPYIHRASRSPNAASSLRSPTPRQLREYPGAALCRGAAAQRAGQLHQRTKRSYLHSPVSIAERTQQRGGVVWQLSGGIWVYLARNPTLPASFQWRPPSHGSQLPQWSLTQRALLEPGPQRPHNRPAPQRRAHAQTPRRCYLAHWPRRRHQAAERKRAYELMPPPQTACLLPTARGCCAQAARITGAEKGGAR